MRKFMLMGALVAVVVAALAIPAMARNGFDVQDFKDLSAGKQDAFMDGVLFALQGDNEEFFNDYLRENEDWLEDNNHPWDEGEQGWFDDWRDDRNNDDRRNNDEVVPAFNQSFEQEAQSGEVNQSFNVRGGGSNSNQCVGIQGVANTGNAQNQIGVIQYGSEADDFSIEDSGASITVSPNSFTSCDQQVNQAASASG